MVIFRENTEDIYAGIEFESGSEDAKKVLAFLKESFPKEYGKIRFPEHDRDRHQAGVERGQRAAGPRRDRVRARQQAQERDARAQGQHHEVHRGRLPQLGLRARRARVRAIASTPGSSGSGPRDAKGEDAANAEQKAALAAGQDPLKDAIADITLQQVLTRPDEFDVIATLEPQRRLPLRRARGAGRRHRHRAGRQHQLHHRPRRLRGHPRHGAQVRQPGQGEPRLGRPLRRDDAALHGLDRGRRPRSSRAWTAPSPASTVTYDFARLMEGAKEVKCSEFADAVIAAM